MSLRSYLFLMSIASLLSWAVLFFVVFSISPSNDNFIGLISFYLSLFMAIVGTYSVCGFLIRRLVMKNDGVVFRHVRRTFRQGILLGLAVILILLLLAQGLLFWWNAIILVVFFIFVELIIFSNYKHSNSNYV